MKKGDIYLANLNPFQGSEQAGTRPVLVFQNDLINRLSRTIIIIPFTTNRRRAELPTCILVQKETGNLSEDSVALCHQIRSIDSSRLIKRIGSLSSSSIKQIEKTVKYTLGIGD